jgi:hypothetical protein
MLWWFDYHIPDSDVSKYSATDTSNFGVDKYYVAKKTKHMILLTLTSVSKPIK